MVLLRSQPNNAIQVFEDIRESPVEWGAFEGTFACEDDASNSRTHSENIYKIHDYTRRAHTLRDVSNAFNERTHKHESKVIGRPGVFRDRNHRIN